jgi:hypothetical protein
MIEKRGYGYAQEEYCVDESQCPCDDHEPEKG